MPIRPEDTARPPGDYLAEPLSAFVGPEELSALKVMAQSFNVDVTRTYQFWESAVARLVDGRLTVHKCPWDVELPYLERPIRIEVKYAQETWCNFRAGKRAIFKFAAPKGAHGAEKAGDVIVLLGIDEAQQVHAWVVPATAVKRCTSITLTSPRFRTGSSRSRGVDGYRCPPTQLLPEVLRAYREATAAVEQAGQLTLDGPEPVPEQRPASGPRCGNNPNYQLSPGDQAAVDDFMAYLLQRATGRTDR